MHADTVVIGAGWSGLACALQLKNAGHRVLVLEAAPQAGGRTRRVDQKLGDAYYALDNGQHVLIGAYTASLQLMTALGVAPEQAFLRCPLRLQYPDGFTFAAAALPAPWHLVAAVIRARGLSWVDRLQLAAWITKQRWCGWQVESERDTAAIELFAGQSSTLLNRLWQPLCIAALNVPLEQACARTFLTVLRDSIAADAKASDLLVPLADLSALLPDAAVRALAHADGSSALKLRCPVLALKATQHGWQVQTRDQTLLATQVVLALPPDRAAALLTSVNDKTLQKTINCLLAIQFAPIATAYLRYPAGTRLPQTFYALTANARAGHYGQWVFDRGALDARYDGVLAVVISGDGPHMALARDDLCQHLALQLGATFQLPTPLASSVIIEKRAAVLPVPQLRRPPLQLPCAGLVLAGDAVDSPYPSTIEGSVRSGLAAADFILRTTR